jgi:hypothetical protein
MRSVGQLHLPQGSLARRMVAAACVFATIACHDDSTSARFPRPDGTWAGVVPTTNQTMSLTVKAVAGSVTGSGSLSGAGQPRMDMSVVAGTFEGAVLKVTLHVNSPSLSYTLYGEVSGDTMVSFLDGNGFRNERITMTR